MVAWDGIVRFPISHYTAVLYCTVYMYLTSVPVEQSCCFEKGNEKMAGVDENKTPTKKWG